MKKKGNIMTENMGTMILIMIVLAILMIIIWTAVKPRLTGGNPLAFLPGA